MYLVRRYGRVKGSHRRQLRQEPSDDIPPRQCLLGGMLKGTLSFLRPQPLLLHLRGRIVKLEGMYVTYCSALAPGALSRGQVGFRRRRVSVPLVRKAPALCFTPWHIGRRSTSPLRPWATICIAGRGRGVLHCNLSYCTCVPLPHALRRSTRSQRS